MLGVVAYFFGIEFNGFGDVIECPLKLFAFEGGLLTVVIEHVVDTTCQCFVIGVVICQRGTIHFSIHVHAGTLQQIGCSLGSEGFHATVDAAVHQGNDFFDIGTCQFFGFGSAVEASR